MSLSLRDSFTDTRPKREELHSVNTTICGICRKAATHDDEIQRLYEEMEQQIKTERDRIVVQVRPRQGRWSSQLITSLTHMTSALYRTIGSLCLAVGIWSYSWPVRRKSWSFSFRNRGGWVRNKNCVIQRRRRAEGRSSCLMSVHSWSASARSSTASDTWPKWRTSSSNRQMMS